MGTETTNLHEVHERELRELKHATQLEMEALANVRKMK
jgi:hypothetical protein